MKVVLSFLIVFCVSFAAPLDSNSTKKDLSPTVIAKSDQNILLNNEQISKKICEATGIAVTPLLGLSTISAYKYFKTSPEQRGQLNWFNQPKIWGIGFIVTIIFLLNSWLGTILPLLKKPMDVIENIEGYVAGAIGLGVTAIKNGEPIVGAMKNTIISFFPASTDHIYLTASIIDPTILQLLAAPLAVLSFVAVWIISNSFNVLILLSPWGGIDLILRSIRISIVGIIVAATAFNPIVGLVVCAFVIAVSLKLAMWSVRLSVYGIINIWDIITFSAKNKNVASKIRCFSGNNFKGIPNRTYGYFEKRGEENIGFTFYVLPLFIKKTQDVKIERTCLLTGLTATKVISDINGKHLPIAELPPRYSKISKEIAESYFKGKSIDSKVKGGIKFAVTWLKEMLGRPINTYKLADGK